MPGSGKTTVGRIVADLLGCRFLDLDAEIVRQQRRSIPEIFEAEGEEGFRKIEGRTLRSLVSPGAKESPVPTLVLALGGGTVLKPGSARIVREDTLCIYLRTRVDTLAGRLADASGRPLLDTDGQEAPLSSRGGRRPTKGSDDLTHRLETLLSQRSPAYEATARLILDTDENHPEDIASEIIVTAL